VVDGVHIDLSPCVNFYGPPEAVREALAIALGQAAGGWASSPRR
jgi:hypothetical protein